MAEREPIGYLFGKPIHVADEPLFEPTTELVMCELTPEIAERFVGSIIAARLADDLVRLAPREAM